MNSSHLISNMKIELLFATFWWVTTCDNNNYSYNIAKQVLYMKQKKSTGSPWWAQWSLVLERWNFRIAWGWKSFLEAAWCPCDSCTYPRINSRPPWSARWPLGLCGCHKDPLSDQIPILPSSAHRWFLITALMWYQDWTGCRFPLLAGLLSIQVPSHTIQRYLNCLWRKKGC